MNDSGVPPTPSQIGSEACFNLVGVAASASERMADHSLVLAATRIGRFLLWHRHRATNPHRGAIPQFPSLLFTMTTSFTRWIAPLFVAIAAVANLTAAAPKPLRVLLITGGCCHDYVTQKDILKKGLEERANVVVDHMHTPDKTTKPPLPSHLDPAYAQGYDVVIHDECAADIKEADMVRNVLKPHRDGIPAVNLHCAMHSYRYAADFAQPLKPGSVGALWFDFLGLQSTRHGPQEPIAIRFVPGASPITKSLENWTTIKEELYNNIQDPRAFPHHRSLATGRQTVKSKDGTTSEVESVIVWTNEYGDKKTRVFSTTLGHNNVTVSDSRYLDLVTRGLLWAAGKLESNGKPASGYGPQRH